MALPMLIGGAECGPSNPLQGLSKRFDQDRGIQQDFFGAGRKGFSKDVFRTQPENVSLHQDSARFFDSGVQSPLASKLAADAAIYDLSTIRAALPALVLREPQQPKPLASWASDFMRQTPLPMTSTEQAPLENSNVALEADALTRRAPAVMPDNLAWAPGLTNFRMNSLPTFVPQVPQLGHPVMAIQNISWEKEFHAQELQLASDAPLVQAEQTKPQLPHDADELALTAGLLLDNLKHEENAKFQNSQFMGLMKQLRDREVIVDGNKIIENDGKATTVDAKGKARAVAQVPLSSGRQMSGAPVFASTMQQEGSTKHRGQQSSNQELRTEREDPNVAYFQRENEDFVNYWNAKPVLPVTASKEAMFWDKLQEDWDEFEAASPGIKAVESYQFQPNNPYLLGGPSRTQHHHMHTGQSLRSESILELEAAVQRNVSDPCAWYELGVKQQENEREHKALQALQRAVDLDPIYLSAWLALAVSHANNNNREQTLEAITSWVSRNSEYKSAVEKFHAHYPPNPQSTLTQRYSQLIQCLISLATSNTSGKIDADIQIALGVLLNTSEEYIKAQDCFRTALDVRPDDWLLYNRVGATMANSGRADQALEYYYRALELNPGYIRARFNLGISYINLRRYEDAAQHILDALILQENDGSGNEMRSNRRGVASTALWDTLKTTSLHLKRHDLALLCDNRDLEGFSKQLHIRRI